MDDKRSSAATRFATDRCRDADSHLRGCHELEVRSLRAALFNTEQRGSSISHRVIRSMSSRVRCSPGRTNRSPCQGGEAAQPSFFNARSRHCATGAGMQTTRTTVVAIGLAAMCAAGLTAQTQETKTTTNTKVEIRAGRIHDRGVSGDSGTTLDGVRRESRARNRRVRPRHQRGPVQARGRACRNPGQGRRKRQRQSLPQSSRRQRQKSKTGRIEDDYQTEGATGVLEPMPFLGVKSMKTLSSSCRPSAAARRRGRRGSPRSLAAGAG